MKKMIQKIRSKFNNTGSSVILVVVALAFIGVLIGSLLSAVGYVYRLKLYDYNARDNFYYVEQAMDEIYAGIGSKTNEFMQDAYTETVNNMVVYNMEQKAYVNIGNEAANKMFKDTFMNNLKDSTYFGINLKDELAKMISNSTVKLDTTALRVEKYTIKNGVEEFWTSGDPLDKIVIKNVTLTRTADYERSTANGQFTQTISADIVIGRPDFTVDFNNINTEYSEIFNFAMIADAGIEINQAASAPLTINGNIYAAADYYNKGYNNYDGAADNVTNYTQASYSTTQNGDSYSAEINIGTGANSDKSVVVNGNKTSYYFNMSKVSSKAYSENDDTANTLYNLGVYESTNHAQKLYYDGVNENSRYSGLYVNGSDVSIMAETVIVPGTIAVMNSGSLSLYGKSGKQLSAANVWTDNVVLGGYSRKNVNINPGTDTTVADVIGSKGNFRANLYVRDDLEINADGADFSLLGAYYGYGDSTTKDSRTFVPTVESKNFQYTDNDGNSENRGHYNSSAILVNGEKSNLDLSRTTTLFLAGRSYIELSKTTTEIQDPDDADVKKETYAFDASINDYKTGESLSLKTNQLAYVPITPAGSEPVWNAGAGYYEAKIPDTLKGSDLFIKYFGDSDTVPCIKITTSGKDNYFYDFANAYTRGRQSNPVPTGLAALDSADEFAEAFILDYCAELNKQHSAIKDYLVDIRKYEDFQAGTIKVPDANLTSVYSSGAITAKSDTEFTIVSQKGTNIKGTLLQESASAAAFQATEFSKDCEKHYAYMKWALADMEESQPEAKFVDALMADANRGESSITPINRYMNFDKIIPSTYIHPAVSGVTGGKTFKLTSGYDVWVSYNDVIVKTDDPNGIVRGMVITKGDVIFDSSVKKFEGLVISGGKVYFNNEMQAVSSNVEICKTILSECQLLGGEDAKFIVSLFKSYEGVNFNDPAAGGVIETKTIDTIDYSDVVRYDNWMKNVE